MDIKELKSKVALVDQYRKEGITAHEAAKKAGFAYSTYSYWKYQKKNKPDAVRHTQIVMPNTSTNVQHAKKLLQMAVELLESA